MIYGGIILRFSHKLQLYNFFLFVFCIFETYFFLCHYDLFRIKVGHKDFLMRDKLTHVMSLEWQVSYSWESKHNCYWFCVLIDVLMKFTLWYWQREQLWACDANLFCSFNVVLIFTHFLFCDFFLLLNLLPFQLVLLMTGPIVLQGDYNLISAPFSILPHFFLLLVDFLRSLIQAKRQTHLLSIEVHYKLFFRFSSDAILRPLLIGFLKWILCPASKYCFTCCL